MAAATLSQSMYKKTQRRPTGQKTRKERDDGRPARFVCYWDGDAWPSRKKDLKWRNVRT